MLSGYPTSFEKVPVIDALFEVRVEALDSLAAMLPALLKHNYEGFIVNLERLPVNDVPYSVRAQDPNLKNQPLFKLGIAGDFQIFVGDSMLAVACPARRYPSGKVFKDKVIDVLEKVFEFKLVQGINRYSMKYTNFIEINNPEEMSSSLSLLLKLGNENLLEQPFSARFHRSDDVFECLVDIMAPADIVFDTEDCKKGLAIGIDNILQKQMDIESFRSMLPQAFDDIHIACKKRFFELLTKQAFKKLGAKYE